MSFLIYQRSDPRYPEWIPLITQQVRLRNLIQVIGINLNTTENEQVYYTLHLPAMSAPFFTSENVQGGSGTVVSWREIEPRQIPNVKLSAAGLVIRVWSTCDGSRPLVSWGIHFKGLHYLGVKGDWNTQHFTPKSILIRMPFGFFTALGCLRTLEASTPIERLVFVEKHHSVCRDSYTVKTLASLHRIQRSLLEELELARRLRFQIGIYGFSSESSEHSMSHTLPLPPSSSSTSSVTCTTLSSTAAFSSSPPQSSSSTSSSNVFALPRSTSITKSITHFPSSSYNLQLVVSGRALLRVQQEKTKLKWKEEIESMKLLVSMLRDEKARAEGRVSRLKKKTLAMEDLAGDLIVRVHALGRERERLRDYKNTVMEMKQKLAEKQSQLSLRKKQLISELLVIYPLQLVEGSKRYSISEIQLPNAEDYGNESGAQVSVALGYTAHFVAMLASILGIPLRYQIRHFGSHSRIIDHITTQIPNKEREFPLYFRGREDVYSKYAVYLLNKNIAQIRWYCGLSTTDLRATLPNLYNVLTSRLIIPGWPPSPGDSCEVAEELTEQNQHLCRNDLSLSLDGGLDQIESLQPKAIDDLRMQSWLRSSFSDLEAVNSVPVSEIQHGSAQKRFLSGWKKKTYSESEDIDPRWLTNSLNLEYDLGRRPSITPSPPLRLPSIVVSNDAKDNVHSHKLRKRRFGRIETTSNLQYQLQKQNICDNANADAMHVPLPQTLTPTDPNGPQTGPSSSSLTPNSRILEVEQQIKANEKRRTSICDTTTGSPTHHLHHSAIISSFALSSSNIPSGNNNSVLTPTLETTDTTDLVPPELQLPVVVSGSTTDEEKEEKLDSIADIVRKISLMEMQLNRVPSHHHQQQQQNQQKSEISDPESKSQSQILSTVHENSIESSSSENYPEIVVSETTSEQEHGQNGHGHGYGDVDSNYYQDASNTMINNLDDESQCLFSDKSEELQIGDNIDIFLRSTETEEEDLDQAQEVREDKDIIKKDGALSSTKTTVPAFSSVKDNDNNGEGSKFSASVPGKNNEGMMMAVGDLQKVLKSNTNKSEEYNYCDNPNNGEKETGNLEVAKSQPRVDNNSGNYINTNSCNNLDINSITSTDDDDDDPSSLWFRTENLLSTQSFNLVNKRRISESN